MIDHLVGPATEVIKIGQPVILNEDNTTSLAEAGETYEEASVIGLSVIDANINDTVRYAADDTIEQLDWTEVIGAQHLTPGAIYFLSLTPGKLTTAPPSVDGQHIVRVGRAMSLVVLAM